MALHRHEYPASGVSRKRIEKCRRIGHNDWVIDNFMNPKVKLAAYAVLLILAAWFGLAFRSNYAAVTKAAAAEPSDGSSAGAPSPAATNTEALAPLSANGVTNVAAQITNASGDVTNAPPATNAATTEPAPRAAAASPPANPAAAAAEAGSARGAMIGYLAGFIAAVIGLGLLIAVDVTRYFGGQASDYLFFDVGDAMRDPDYERAEAEWANGTYLEAVQILRDYLKKNPREVHASLRIAEIYEKDLKNHLAAALEYEEVLKNNLYSKLNQHDKTRDLLHRIVNEYPKTAAAKKARVRLGVAELEEEPVTEETVETFRETAHPPVRDAQDGPEAPPAEPEPPKPTLPPGFRPKK